LIDYKRVEFDQDYVYISNYIKTIRIPIDGVKYIKISKNPLLVSRLILFQKGYFGDTIKFLKYDIGIDQLKKTRPDLVL
jgi:hypothetical protein